MRSRWGRDNETVAPSSSACPVVGRIQARRFPSFSQPMGVRMAHQTRFWGSIMSTGARNEKKKNEKQKDRSKNEQPTSQPAPAVQQIHVVLWDEPPKRDPQENDTDLEPDLLRANPIGASYVTASSSEHADPFGQSAECARFTFRLMGLNLSRDAVSRTQVQDEPCGKEVTSRRSPSVSQYGSTVILFNR